MSSKIFITDGEEPPVSQIGATLDALSSTIAARADAGLGSYSYRLLTGSTDTLVKKVMEEAAEVALAAKDVDSFTAELLSAPVANPRTIDGQREWEEEREAALDHLRYEAADVVYHLMVVLSRYGIDNEEFAAELNARMTDEERPAGAVRLNPDHINRG